MTNKALIALGFLNLTRCACSLSFSPCPESCVGLCSAEGYNHPKDLVSSYFHINLPLDSMSFQTTRECDEWPNECIISVVGVQTFAWRTVLCCTAGTLSSISCRVWAKCPPDFSVQSWKALWFHQWWNPGQDLRVLIMSVINIFHFQVALVCLPLRDVSAESQAGLSSFVSLTFFFPRGKGSKSLTTLLLLCGFVRVRALSVQSDFLRKTSSSPMPK